MPFAVEEHRPKSAWLDLFQRFIVRRGEQLCIRATVESTMATPIGLTPYSNWCSIGPIHAYRSNRTQKTHGRSSEVCSSGWLGRAWLPF
jgi:hypothetical protein